MRRWPSLSLRRRSQASGPSCAPRAGAVARGLDFCDELAGGRTFAAPAMLRSWPGAMPRCRQRRRYDSDRFPDRARASRGDTPGVRRRRAGWQQVGRSRRAPRKRRSVRCHRGLRPTAPCRRLWLPAATAARAHLADSGRIRTAGADCRRHLKSLRAADPEKARTTMRARRTPSNNSSERSKAASSRRSSTDRTHGRRSCGRAKQPRPAAVNGRPQPTCARYIATCRAKRSAGHAAPVLPKRLVIPTKTPVTASSIADRIWRMTVRVRRCRTSSAAQPRQVVLMPARTRRTHRCSSSRWKTMSATFPLGMAAPLIR